MDDVDFRLITGLQVRMARGALGWSVQKLGEQANVNKNTVVRFEHNKPTTPPTIEKIQRTLEGEGIDFIWHAGREGIISPPDPITRSF